jgi:hypothetical protein
MLTRTQTGRIRQQSASLKKLESIKNLCTRKGSVETQTTESQYFPSQRTPSNPFHTKVPVRKVKSIAKPSKQMKKSDHQEPENSEKIEYDWILKSLEN